MIARRLFLCGFAAALLAALGCSDSGSSSGTPTNPAFTCADGGAAGANAVTMTCGGLLDSVTEQVNVVIGGPSSGSTNLRGLNFDVTFDSTKLTFVSASLNAAGPFASDALVVASAEPAATPTHVVVSIQQTGGNPDVTIASGQQAVVMHLAFAHVGSPATFAGSPLSFDPASSETTPPGTGVTFGSSLALSYQ
jgi:hypothetical protein